MGNKIVNKKKRNKMDRRTFIKTASATTAGALAAGPLSGCATNPVTGESQFMLMSPEQEVAVDKESSPHQFSSDYGPSTDKQLVKYIDGVGQAMAAKTHRPDMPYSFRPVNATYVNAYAFPGGSIAVTRGILLELENEAELAGLTGHELGHVNARHTASRMSKGMLAQLAVIGASAYAASRDPNLGQLAYGLGGVGAGMLLASYSRADERQADSLGMEYMVKSGYNPQGMVGLMDVLRSMSKHKPSAIQTMFSTHPMSDERYATAVSRTEGEYSGDPMKLPVHRERYMDNTSRLRAMKGAIESMQKGEKLMAQGKFGEAEKHFATALKKAPDDYAGNVMMSKCQIALEKPEVAKRYAEKAKAINPQEAQAHHVAGLAKMYQSRWGSAYNDFASYEKLLPGNSNTVFFKALSLEGMGKRREAAHEYNRYLQSDQQSKQAEYAYQRLVRWGYVNQ